MRLACKFLVPWLAVASGRNIAGRATDRVTVPSGSADTAKSMVVDPGSPRLRQSGRDDTLYDTVRGGDPVDAR